MNDDELEPLSTNAIALFRAEAAREGVDLDAQERAYARVELALMCGAAAVAGTAMGAAGGAALAGASSAAAAQTKAGLWSKVVGLLFAKPALVVLSSVAIGGAAGAGGYAALTTKSQAAPPPIAPTMFSPPTPLSATSVPLPEPVAPPPVSAAPIPSPAVTDFRTTHERAAPSALPAVGPVGSERLLLETARTALARGDGSAALASLDRHAARYPHGQLAEEREALAVQALVLARRASEARARAGRFHERFPDSLLSGAVDSALRTLP